MSTTVWTGIALLAVINFALKAAGPVALGGRELGPTFTRIVALLPAALLTALVLTQTVADGARLVVDARAGGILAAIVVIALGGRMLLVLLAAAAVTAGLRALGLAA